MGRAGRRAGRVVPCGVPVGREGSLGAVGKTTDEDRHERKHDRAGQAIGGRESPRVIV